MRQLLLHVPGRRPPDWNDHLAEDEYAVFLSDVRTDAEVTADGNPRPPQMPSVCLVFENQTAARAYCEQRVREVDHLKCEMYDRKGMAVGPIVTFVNPEYATRLPNRRTAWRLLLAACACFAASPPLFWLDWRSGGGLVVPTFIGFSLIVTGVRLLFWGYGVLLQAREQQRQQPAGAVQNSRK